MCDYTHVEYSCGHSRYIVLAWCLRYQETHKRCPLNVVAREYRRDEKCGDCKDTSSSSYLTRKPSRAGLINQESKQEQPKQQEPKQEPKQQDAGGSGSEGKEAGK